MERAINEVKDFDAEMILIVVGVDTYTHDPLASLSLNKSTYSKIAKRIRDLNNKAVLFAGGYSKEVPELWWSFVKEL